MPHPTQEPLPRLLHGSHTDHLLQWSDQFVGKLEEHLKKFALPILVKTFTNGLNNNLDIKNAMLLRVSGPTGAFTITGIGGGYNGRMLFIHNPTSQNLTIANESASSAAANRILTTTGADISGTGESSALLVYDTNRWVVISAEGLVTGGGGATTSIERLLAWRQLNSTVATTFTGVGITNPSTTGSASIAHDSTGRWIDYSTTDTINLNGGWTTPAAVQESQTRFKPEITIIVRLPSASDLTSARVWVGWFSGDPMGSDTAGTGAGGNVAGFRFSTSAGDTNWMTYTEDGADNDTIKNSNVLVAAGTIYRLRVKVVTSALIEFYINDVLVQSHTETLPTSSTNVFQIASTRNLVGGIGSAKHFQISRMNMSEATAG